MRKRKWRKRLWSMVISVLLIMQTTTSVFADDSNLYVDGSWLVEASESESTELLDFTREVENENIPVPFTTYLFGGVSKITNAGDGKVNAYANTKASTTCDTVKVDIYLQYYSDGAWVYVNNWNYTVKDVSHIARSRTVSVTKGRYYRIKCYHAITKNGIKESCTTVTNGIKIE